MSRRRPILERVMERVVIDDSGCWQWTGVLDRHGYGKVGLGGTDPNTTTAHRVVFDATKGSRPDGMVIDHLCRNRACVNPEHMEAVPIGENTRRGVVGYGARSLCRAGLHDITDPANVYIYPSSRGRRRTCRPCQLESSRKRKAAA